MDNENHKNTWNNFTKVCFMGNNCSNTSACFDGNISFIKFSMNLVSISENKNLKKE